MPKCWLSRSRYDFSSSWFLSIIYGQTDPRSSEPCWQRWRHSRPCWKDLDTELSEWNNLIFLFSIHVIFLHFTKLRMSAEMSRGVIPALILVAVISELGAEKERPSDQSLDQLTSKLFHELEKRLQEDGLDSQDALEAFGRELESANPNSCHYNSSEGTIVRTQDSLDRGAKFLNSFDDTTDPTLTRESCLQACCDEDQCNLAVYKMKVSHWYCIMDFSELCNNHHYCSCFKCLFSCFRAQLIPATCLIVDHPVFASSLSIQVFPLICFLPDTLVTSNKRNMLRLLSI